MSVTNFTQASSVGKKVRALRKQSGLTQIELARQIGIQQSDLSRMEKGHYRISLDNLFRILGVFGMEIADFFAEQAPPARQQPLSHEDMRALKLLRSLEPIDRSEALEFLEFKARRAATTRPGLGSTADDSRHSNGS